MNGKKLFRDHRYDFWSEKIELPDSRNFLFLKSYYDFISSVFYFAILSHGHMPQKTIKLGYRDDHVSSASLIGWKLETEIFSSYFLVLFKVHHFFFESKIKRSISQADQFQFQNVDSKVQKNIGLLKEPKKEWTNFPKNLLIFFSTCQLMFSPRKL